MGRKMTESQDRNEDYSKESEEKFEDGDFSSTTSRSAWDSVKITAGKFMRDAVDVADTLAQRGKIELEIASIKMGLRAAHAELGKRVFHLSEAEENPNPMEDDEVQRLFDEVRARLAELSDEYLKLDKLKQQASKDEYAGA